MVTLATMVFAITVLADQPTAKVNDPILPEGILLQRLDAHLEGGEESSARRAIIDAGEIALRLGWDLVFDAVDAHLFDGRIISEHQDDLLALIEGTLQNPSLTELIHELEALRAGETAFESTISPVGRAIRLNIFASVLNEAYQVDLAAQALEASIELADSIGLHLGVGHPAGSLGWTLRYAADGPALEYLNRAVQEFRGMGHDYYAMNCLSLRSDVNRLWGRSDDARRDYLEARDYARAFGEPDLIGHVLMGAAFQYTGAGELDEAESIAGELLADAEAMDAEVLYFAGYRLLGEIARARDELGAASEHYERARTYSRTPYNEVACLHDLAMVHFASAEFDSARAILQMSLSITDTLDGEFPGNVWARDVWAQVEYEIPNYPPAIELMTQVVADYEQLQYTDQAANRKSTLANVHNDFAIALADSDRVDEAIPHYEESIRLFREIGDTQAEVIVLGNLAREHEDQHDLDAAEEAKATMLEKLQESGDTEEIQEAVRELSDLRYRQGDYAAAAEMYRRMAELRKAEGDHVQYVQWLLQLASSLRQHGDHVGSGEVLDELGPAAEEIVDPLLRRLQRALIINSRGVLLFSQNDLPASLALHDRAAAEMDTLDTLLGEIIAAHPDSTPSVDRQENLSHLVNARRNALVAKMVMGQKGVVEEFAALKEIYLGRLDEPIEAAEIELNLGWYIQREDGYDTEEVRRHFHAAAEILDAIEEEARDGEWTRARASVHYEEADLDDTIVARLMRNGLEAADTDSLTLFTERATANFSKAMMLCKTIDYKIGQFDAFRGLANLVLRLEDDTVRSVADSGMIAKIDNVLALGRQIDYQSGVLDFLQTKMKYAHILGYSDIALESVREALELHERMIAQHAASESRRTEFRQEQSKLYKSAVVLMLENGLVSEAMDVLNRSKSQELVDLIQSTEVAFDSPEKQEAFEKLQTLMREKLESERAAAMEAAKPKQEQDPMTLAQLRARRPRARQALNEYVTELLETNREILSYLSIQPASLQGLEDRLPEEMIVLEYLPMDDQLIIFVATAGETPSYRNVPVTLADLESRVRRYRELLSAGKVAKRNRRVDWSSKEAVATLPASHQELIELSVGLRNDLIGPVDSLIAGRSMIAISPSRILHYLPFESLAAESEDGYRFLIEDHGVFYFTLANFLDVFGTIDEANRDELSLLAFAPPNSDLPMAQAEVQQVGRVFADRAQLIVGSEATEDTAFVVTGAHSIIHFATHGHLYFDDPKLSNLLMAKPGSPGSIAMAFDGTAPDSSGESMGAFDLTDGHLTIGEINGLELSGSLLVTLSACETALGPQAAGGEIMGLAQAFIRFGGGVPSVVASLWRVDDEGTADLMVNFYENLLNPERSLGRLEALREAKLTLLDDPYFAHPYFWAPFVLIGDSR